MFENWKIYTLALCSSALVVAACGSSEEPSGNGSTPTPDFEEQVCAGENDEFTAGSPPAVSLSFGLDCELGQDNTALCEQFFFEFELSNGEVIGYDGPEQITRLFEFSYDRTGTGVESVLIALNSEDDPFGNGHAPVLWLNIPHTQYEPGTVSIADLTHRGNIDGCFDESSCPILLLRSIAEFDVQQPSSEYQLGVPRGGLLLIDSAGTEPGEVMKMSATEVPLEPATELYGEVLCDDGNIWFRPPQ